jgi:hypothetical protein
MPVSDRLRTSSNVVSREQQELRELISQHKAEELREARENCTMRDFIICTVH